MSRFPVLWSIAALAAMLAACASAPTHLYTLVPPAPAQYDTKTTAAFVIDVEPVSVPAEVDQAAWLVRTGRGQVAVLDNERWAAPLSDELRAAFADALTRLLAVLDVHASSAPANMPVYRIRVDVRRFESVPGKDAMIRADWSVTPPSSPGNTASVTALTCSSRASEPVGPGYAALAVGHQKALANIAGEIANTVRDLVAGKRSCPAS